MVTFGPTVSGLLTAGQHGTTFGGNPLAASAGLAVLDTIERRACSRTPARSETIWWTRSPPWAIR